MKLLISFCIVTLFAFETLAAQQAGSRPRPRFLLLAKQPILFAAEAEPVPAK
jgi:hypothetical protein